MNKGFSQIAADIFARPMEGKDLPSRVRQLGDELGKAIQNDATIYGKFRGLLDSFRTIIPDETQRYLAALQALSTTSKLSRQDIMKALSGQVEEMKLVEKGLMPSLSGWRDGLRSMEARSQALKGEMAHLQARIAQLENEDRSILAGMTALEKDLAQAETSIRDLFANIGAEITAVSRKMAELPAEIPAAQPAPASAPAPAPQPAAQPAAPTASVKSAAPVEKKAEAQAASPAEETKWEKKCPMCGGRFNLLELQNLWQCYTCGYEEPAAGAAQRTSVAATAPSPPPAPAEEQPRTPVEPATSAPDESERPVRGGFIDEHASAKKKPCPSCRKKMFWYPEEKAWRCPSCNYERRI